MEANVYGTDSIVFRSLPLPDTLSIPEPNNCPICLIEREDWYKCNRCQKRVCIDCRNHDLSIHETYPTVIWPCCHCRYKQQIDGLEDELSDYQKLGTATLAKMVLLYKKKISLDWTQLDSSESSD